MLTEEEKKNL